MTEYTFDPGSTMKVMTLASAIQEGTFRPYDYYKSGKIEIGGGTVQ
ncbi:MAG: penicillin-binding transpeptidase domain-containing protein [Alkalibacterium sp.]|nr:penicillin-binding transpeptidase domain-containing protein [Alkalibacterium sp.]